MANLNDIEKKVQNIIDILSSDTITGNLPLIFTAKAGNAVDWTIYGNAEGVGERTVNLFDVNAEKEVAFSATYKYTLIGLEAGQYYTCSTNFESADHSTASLYFGGSSSNANGVWASRPLTVAASSQGTIDVYVRFISYGTGAPNIYDDIVAGNVWVMVVKGSTAPSSYVPYGYEIPISVNDIPQTFYIGSSPLTAGQSISKTSTGIDIELLEGENIISTTLYNKPKMTIKYKNNGGN